MSVKRFVGATTRDVMRQVRLTLGPEALILASREVPEGVEILAIAEDDLGVMTQGAVAAEAPQVKSAAVTPTPAASPDTDFAALSSRLLSEMQEMREMLSRQPTHTDTEVDHSLQAWVQRCVLDAGFSQQLVEELLSELPPVLLVEQGNAADWLYQQLSARILVPDSELELLNAGGVVALIGPTGVGKTTTTAKLASHYVLHHGNQGLALISTDSYRVGAKEQLAIYADILGVDMYALSEEVSLKDLLNKLTDKHLVLVDTMGMSQRDQRLVEQVGQLCNGDLPVRLLLLLNAASQRETLAEVVDTYKAAATAAGVQLQDCILTKSDEAARLGPLLDTIIYKKLRLHWLSCGQRVPEDLVPVDRQLLVREALAIAHTNTAQETPKVLEKTVVTSTAVESQSAVVSKTGRTAAGLFAVLEQHVPDFNVLQQAWALIGLPVSLQAQRLSELYSLIPQRDCSAVLWARQKPLFGCAWLMPDLALSDAGLPLLLARQDNADLVSHIAWASDTLGVASHILPGLPEAPVWQWLAEREMPWIAVVHGNTLHGNTFVHFQDARCKLVQLPSEQLAAYQGDLRYRGQSVQVVLQHWPVQMKSDSTQTQAWCATLSVPNSELVVERYYWLAPDYAEMDDCIRLIFEQLRHDELPGLTRQARSLLEASGLVAQDNELLRFLSTSIAALACYLDYMQTRWAIDLRTHLAHVLGRRSYNASVLLDAVVHLLVTTK